MRHNRMLSDIRAAFLGSACLVLATGAFVSSAAAASVVSVALTDPSAGGSIQGMRIIAAPDTVKAGTVTFHATNGSKSHVHEMILVHQPPNGRKLPYNDKRQRVDESRIKSLGEVSELEPGKSGTLTVKLQPGDYLLFCNQAGHYASGMRTSFKVKR